MIDQLQIIQALRPSADYCIDGEITESRISTCIRYVVSVDELIVALWEGVVEERMASVTALEANRQAVKTKYPKP